VAIKEEQLTRPNYLTLCMLNKVLQPLNSKLVSRLTVVTKTDSLISQYILLVLGREVVPAGKDNKQQDSLASSVNSLDYYCLLAIARLDSL
jgi:hypothetical protein